MNDVFLLYLLTRLDAIHYLLSLVLFIGSIFWLIASSGMNLYADKEKFAQVFPYWKLLAVVAVINVLIPTQKDATFIIAGTGILEAMKDENTQRIAGKSIQFIEKYLDQALNEGKADALPK